MISAGVIFGIMGHSIPDYIFILCVVIYGISFYLDIKSTISFNRGVVSQMEISITFRGLVKRFGFGIAVMIQLSIEVLIVLVVIPFVVLYQFDYIISGVSFVLLAVIHFIGFRSNDVLRLKLQKN